MAVNRPGEVISIDLRSGALPPATFEELSLVNAELSTVKGIVKPWNILVICSAKDLNGYVAFFQMLMISKARPRVILLLVEIPITIDGIEYDCDVKKLDNSTFNTGVKGRNALRPIKTKIWRKNCFIKTRTTAYC